MQPTTPASNCTTLIIHTIFHCFFCFLSYHLTSGLTAASSCIFLLPGTEQDTIAIKTLQWTVAMELSIKGKPYFATTKKHSTIFNIMFITVFLAPYLWHFLKLFLYVCHTEQRQIIPQQYDQEILCTIIATVVSASCLPGKWSISGSIAGSSSQISNWILVNSSITISSISSITIGHRPSASSRLGALRLTSTSSVSAKVMTLR